MVGQGERSSSDGKIVIPTAWTGQPGLLLKIFSVVLLLFLGVTEIGELLTGEAFGLGDRGIWWVRLSAMCECCCHGSVSQEMLGIVFAETNNSIFSVLTPYTPPSGFVLRFPPVGRPASTVTMPPED